MPRGWHGRGLAPLRRSLLCPEVPCRPVSGFSGPRKCPREQRGPSGGHSCAGDSHARPAPPRCARRPRRPLGVAGDTRPADSPAGPQLFAGEAELGAAGARARVSTQPGMRRGTAPRRPRPSGSRNPSDTRFSCCTLDGEVQKTDTDLRILSRFAPMGYILYLLTPKSFPFSFSKVNVGSLFCEEKK